jgi:DNA modification methylase
MTDVTLHHGDCLAVLKTIPDASVDSIVTDPPYGLSFMGKRWDYDVPSVEIWAECLRVLKPGGHLLAFAGTRTQHRMAVRIEDAGFEIRDMIAWVYGSGFPKSHNLKGDWQGWGTALKPALEPITVARKPLIGTVAENVLAHGTGALNVDGCRISADDGDNRARPPRTPNAILGGGNGTNLTASEHNDIGRWPANLIHDGSEEVLSGFPFTKTGVCPADGASGYNGGLKRRDNSKAANGGDSGSAARFFYCAKASKRDRDEGCENIKASNDTALGNGLGRVCAKCGAKQLSPCDCGEPWILPPRLNHHPTVKPTDLMRYLCRLVTPPGGIVLDPFMGSGSTGKAAKLEGFNFIGIELDADYLKIASARIEASQ